MQIQGANVSAGGEVSGIAVQSSVKRPIMARAIARGLEKVLCEKVTAVHWVAVVCESSLQPEARVILPDLDEHIFNVLVSDGITEGCLVYVMAQESRYRPEVQLPVLQIKMLCSRKALIENDLRHINDFVERLQADPSFAYGLQDQLDALVARRTAS